MFSQLKLLFIHYGNMRKKLLQLINKKLALLDTDVAVHVWGSEGLRQDGVKRAEWGTYVILSMIKSY